MNEVRLVDPNGGWIDGEVILAVEDEYGGLTHVVGPSVEAIREARASHNASCGFARDACLPVVGERRSRSLAPWRAPATYECRAWHSGTRWVRLTESPALSCGGKQRE